MDPVRSKKSKISVDSLEASRTSNGMDKEKVLNLAKLARIELGNEEAEGLTREFEAILDYVKEVKGVNTNGKTLPCREDFAVINVMREDKNSHESGLYTQKILEQAPAKEGDYIKVKKIL